MNPFIEREARNSLIPMFSNLEQLGFSGGAYCRAFDGTHIPHGELPLEAQTLFTNQIAFFWLKEYVNITVDQVAILRVGDFLVLHRLRVWMLHVVHLGSPQSDAIQQESRYASLSLILNFSHTGS